jgi:hypothetical protein
MIVDKIVRTTLPFDEVEEEDPMDDPVLGPILRDLEQFKLLQKELEQPHPVEMGDEIVSSGFDYKQYSEELE